MDIIKLSLFGGDIISHVGNREAFYPISQDRMTTAWSKYGSVILTMV